MRRLTQAVSSLLTIFALSVPVCPRDQSPANQNIVSQARGAYYSLARKGFKGFTAMVEPNWEVILAQTATSQNLKIFRDVKFTMVVDENGAVTVTHELGPNASSPELQPTVTRIHNDVQRLVGSFFNTWRLFVVSSPFPETEMKIENSGKQYRASYTTQSGDVTIAMTDDLLIKEWNLTSPTAKRTIKPEFQKTADGLLLTDYKQIFAPVGDGIKTTIDLHIEYQEFNGMNLPQKVRLSGMYGNEPVEAELTFIAKPG